MLVFQEGILNAANAKKDYTDLEEKVEKLRNQKEEVLLKIAEEKNIQNRLKNLEDFIDNQEFQIDNYDENLIRKLIDIIVVYDEKLKMAFKSGFEVEIEK